jgi:uncharacterized protein (TIGR02246 family)
MMGQSTARQEIEERNAEFGAAFKRGDAAGIAALYTDDAQLLPPGGQKITGRQAIEQFWQGAMGMGIQEATLNTEHVEESGDLAYEVGSATLKIQPRGGSATTDTVKYVVCWKRRAGGRWHLDVDIWNSNG